MLTRYNERGGTRNQLVKGLKKVEENIQSKEVIRGDYFVICEK